MRLVILTWRKSKRIRRAALDLGQPGIAIPRTIQLLLALFEVWQVVVVLLLLIMPTGALNCNASPAVDVIIALIAPWPD